MDCDFFGTGGGEVKLEALTVKESHLETKESQDQKWKLEMKPEAGRLNTMVTNCRRRHR